MQWKHCSVKDFELSSDGLCFTGDQTDFEHLNQDLKEHMMKSFQWQRRAN
jgi:hypothetical protein